MKQQKIVSRSFSALAKFSDLAKGIQLSTDETNHLFKLLRKLEHSLKTGNKKQSQKSIDEITKFLTELK